MDDGAGRKKLGHYFPHMVAATTSVTVAPVLIVTGLERAGLLHSLLLSSLLGVVLSVVAAVAGSALWTRTRAARDLVFGDLMVWGYWRRLRNDKDVAEMIGLLEAADSEADRSEMTPERRIEILQKLAAGLELSDPYTHGHTRRVARHSESIARAMRLPPATVAKIRTAAAVHDVGKMHISDEILNKPGKLSDEEFEVIKLHSVHGAEMVDAIGDPELTSLVRHHHERMDGRGYPDRLLGEDIPLGARIIAVADTFDAITSSRVYRSATHHRKAIEILKKEAGSQLDEKAVEAFLSYYSGRSSIEWWAAVTTAPQRLLGRALTLVQQAGPSTLAGTAATGLAAVITGAALVAPVAGRPEPERRNRDVQTTILAEAPADHAPVKVGGTPSSGRDRHGPRTGSKSKLASPGSKVGPNNTESGGGPTKPSGGGGAGAGEDPGTGGGSAPVAQPGGDASPPQGGAPPPEGGDPGAGPGGSETPGGSVGDAVDGVTDTADGVVDDLTDAVDDIIGGVLGGL